MRVGVITDRLSTDIVSALKIASDIGADFVEIRSIDSRRVPAVTPDETRKIAEALPLYSRPALALAPGTFRCSLYDKEFGDQFPIFEQTIDLAAEWGAGAIVTNGVRRHWKDRRGDYRRIIDSLSKCIQAAASRGIEVWIENDFGWFNDSMENILRMQKVLAELGAKTCWNIAGYYASGADGWKDFLASLGGSLACVHISDILTGSTQRAHFPVEDILASLGSMNTDIPVVIDGVGFPDPDRAEESLHWIKAACSVTADEI